MLSLNIVSFAETINNEPDFNTIIDAKQAAIDAEVGDVDPETIITDSELQQNLP